MTADTPARVSDQITELRKAATCVYIAVEKAVADDMSRIFSAAAQTIHQQGALTQAQAERIAALESRLKLQEQGREAAESSLTALGAEVARLTKCLEHAHGMHKIAGTRAEAAESSLAETRAKVERSAKVLRRARHHLVCLHASTPQQVSLIDDIDAALAALPEAKPAAQALPDPRNTSAPWQPPIVEKLP